MIWTPCSACAGAGAGTGTGLGELGVGVSIANHGCLPHCTTSTYRVTRSWVATGFLDPSRENRWACLTSRCDEAVCRHSCESQEALWGTPGWADAQLAAVDMRMGRRATASNWNMRNDLGLRRPAGYETDVTADTVSHLCQQGQFSEAVEGLGVLVETDYHVCQSLLYTVLKGCATQKHLVLGRRVHALTVKGGFESDTFLCNHILRMYATHASLQEAMDVFTVVGKPDAFMWSSIISAHVEHGQDAQAIQLYHQLRRSSVKPDGHVFVAALQACAKGADLETGKQVHADVLASGGEPDLFVSSGLVDMYAKCGSLEEAQRVFDGLGRKNVVTWTALIAGYAQQGKGQQALQLYDAMQQEGLAAPNCVTFVCLLQACASVGSLALEQGKQLHAQIGERGLQADVAVGCSLVDMYAKCGSLEDALRVFDKLPHKDVATCNALIAGCVKCGSLEDAQKVFDRLPHKNIATWNAMIAGYSQQGMGQEALHLYRGMQGEGIVAPNAVTFVCLLQACADVAALHVGKQLHAQIVEQGLQADVPVAVSLINMYAKCGSMVRAQQVFEALPERGVVAWNALIAGYSHQVDTEMVFDLFNRMREDGTQPTGITFVGLLTVCSHAGLVKRGQEFFEAMSRHYGISPTVEHYTCMVDLLGRAGQLDEALVLVRSMPLLPDAAVWHTLLGACQMWSNVEVGTHAFKEAVNLDKNDTAAYMLMSNIYRGAKMWEQAQEMQERRTGTGAWKEPGRSWWTDMDGLVHSFLVGDAKHPESEGIYAMLERLIQKMKKDVQLVAVDKQMGCSNNLNMPHDHDYRRPSGLESGVTADTVRKLCQQGHIAEAVEALGLLVQTHHHIPRSLFYTVLKRCGLHKDLVLGRCVHALIMRGQYKSDTFLSNCMLRMYSTHDSLQEAMDVFTMVAKPDAFIWSSLISAHVKHGQDNQAIQLYHQMRRSSVKPDGHVFAAALQACARAGDLTTGQQLHADVLASGVEPDLFVCSCLVDMYAKCGSLEDAQRVFDGIGQKNVVTWTALIAGYAQQGMGEEALHIYNAMREEGTAVPDSVTFVSLLQACATVGAPALETGKQLHTQIGERGLQTDVKVGGSLVNMYAKCGSLEDAQRVFDGLGKKNVVTWTALIAGYVKCGNLEDAQGVFDGLPHKDVVMWNAMIGGYAQQGMGQESLRLYRAMQKEGAVAPDAVTFVCLLQACANVAALRLGKQLHAQITQQGLQSEMLVAISLINMYAKSGSMFHAQQVFEALPKRDVVAWNALIAGYSRQGDNEVVFDLFRKMREDGIQPTGVTFLSVLTVCSHAGLVKDGREYFEAMTKQHGISPTVGHYTTMMDLLGRAGLLDEALDLVRTMPILPDSAVWHSLLGACRMWSNVEVGFHAFQEAVKLDENDTAAYVLMSNIYKGVNMWEQAEEMQARRTGMKAWKEPGQSWWTDTQGIVHTFLVGDKKHPDSVAVYASLKQLICEMKNAGYARHLGSESWLSISVEG